jgi:hypothetical protein
MPELRDSFARGRAKWLHAGYERTNENSHVSNLARRDCDVRATRAAITARPYWDHGKFAVIDTSQLESRELSNFLHRA